MARDFVSSLIERGLYDPAAADAEQRLALLAHYDDLGITLDQMVEASEAGRLGSLSGDVKIFDLGSEMEIREVAERCGVTVERVQRMRLATGLPSDLDVPVPSWVTEDVAGFVLAADLFGEPATLAFSRVMGASAARLAEAAVSLFLSEVDTRLFAANASYMDWAAANELGAELIDVVKSIDDHLLREHLALAIRRQRALVEPGEGAVLSTAIGFVDLAHSTEWASVLAPRAQAAALARFESAAWDLAVRHGGRIVKLIGDEVMFTAPGVCDACAIALELCEAVDEESSLPRARGAVGFGQVAFRDGDYYGPLVHVIARAVKAADEGGVVADDAVRARCEAAGAALGFVSVGPQELRGVPEPVELFRVSTQRGPH